jgi:HAD superfamily hydrolase (TIGR01509 family)
MNRSLHNIKAVLFDFGGTIDSDGIPWKERFYPLYKNEGFHWSEKEYSKYFYSSDDYWTEKQLNRVSYSETLIKQVSLLLKNADAYEKALAKKIAKQFLSDSIKTIKRNLPLIRELHKKYRLGIVSNFYGNLPFIFQEIGLTHYFGAIIDSSNVGVIKPDPKIFKAALDKLNVSANESVFIGDSLKRDMTGAKMMGMKHIWVKNKEMNVGKPCCKEDLVIHSFMELKEILL